MTDENSIQRPFQVTVIGWLFIVVGIVSTAYHLWRGGLDRWTPLIVLAGAIAVGAGTLLLRGGMGARWARWVVVAWLAFHVVVGTLDSWREAAPHMVLLIVIAYFLFGSPTAAYFRRNGPLVI